jgi:CNT family concentrative nucleoside transporter
MDRMIGLVGIAVLIAIGWAMSTDRRQFPWRLVLAGVGLQAVLGALMLRDTPLVGLVDAVTRVITAAIDASDAGIEFLFGPAVASPGAGAWGFMFLVHALPKIVFMASLMAVLYHVGVMQRLVAGLAWLLQRTLRVTGTEALATAANVFVGQTEAPLCIKPYLQRMTRSQLNLVMTGGFATIAGSVLAAYVGMLGGDDPAERAMWVKQLLTASVMSAPAAFVLAKVIVPETESPPDESDLRMAEDAEPAANLFDAAARGATDGMRLAINVAAMLVAFVSLLALVNMPLEALGRTGWLDGWLASRGVAELNLQIVLGAVFAPLAWAMGVPWEDSVFFGRLMGEKLVVTEFVAYQTLAEGVRPDQGPALLGDRSARMAAFALCGFANFASIGIQIGGLSALVPGRRKDLVSLAMRAMIGGALASWVTAAVAGIVMPA